MRDKTSEHTWNIECANRLSIMAIEGIPIIEPGDELGKILSRTLRTSKHGLVEGDILAVASKLFSRAENQFVSLESVRISPRAYALSKEVHKDPRLVQLILDESIQVSRKRPGVLITRHRLGHVSANAGIDSSNVSQEQEGNSRVLLLPSNPNLSAKKLRLFLEKEYAVKIGVVVTDSLGRPFRFGTVGHALGCSGLPALWEQRGDFDLFGRALEHTVTALADQVAGAADLVLGQGSEGRGAAIIRGLRFPRVEEGAEQLHRPRDKDLYI